MINIKTDSTTRSMAKSLKAMADTKLKKAAATALTKTAAAVVVAERKRMTRVLDRPRPFTLNAVQRYSASWNATPIRARVYIMDTQSVPTPTAKYLEPYEFGGKNVLNVNSKYLLNPVSQPKDQFGNLPWATLAKLRGGIAKRGGKAYKFKGRGDIYIGTLTPKGGQPINGVWQRPYKAPVTARRGRGSGKYGAIGKRNKRSNTTGKFILLMRFQPAHAIASKNRLHWFETAGYVIEYQGTRLLRDYMRQYTPRGMSSLLG